MMVWAEYIKHGGNKILTTYDSVFWENRGSIGWLREKNLSEWIVGS